MTHAKFYSEVLHDKASDYTGDRPLAARVNQVYL